MIAQTVFDNGKSPDDIKSEIADIIQQQAVDGRKLIDVVHRDDVIALYFEEME